MDEDFVMMKIDMRNALKLVSPQALLEESSLNFSIGLYGAMTSTQLCDIQWVFSVWKLLSSTVTH